MCSAFINILSGSKLLLTGIINNGSSILYAEIAKSIFFKKEMQGDDRAVLIVYIEEWLISVL